MFEVQFIRRALPFYFDSAGRSNAARMAMIAITTSNSINVNALRAGGRKGLRPSARHTQDAGDRAFPRFDEALALRLTTRMKSVFISDRRVVRTWRLRIRHSVEHGSLAR